MRPSLRSARTVADGGAGARPRAGSGGRKGEASRHTGPSSFFSPRLCQGRAGTASVGCVSREAAAHCHPHTQRHHLREALAFALSVARGLPRRAIMDDPTRPSAPLGEVVYLPTTPPCTFDGPPPHQAAPCGALRIVVRTRRQAQFNVICRRGQVMSSD